MKDIIKLKIQKLEKIIDDEFEQIVVLEVRIRVRKESMKTFPKDAERPLKIERVNAEIERFQNDIDGREYTIKIMKMMLKEYQKIDSEGNK